MTAADGGVQLGSQLWKTALQTCAPPSAPGGHPPQSVKLLSVFGPHPSHAKPHS